MPITGRPLVTPLVGRLAELHVDVSHLFAVSADLHRHCCIGAPTPAVQLSARDISLHPTPDLFLPVNVRQDAIFARITRVVSPTTSQRLRSRRNFARLLWRRWAKRKFWNTVRMYRIQKKTATAIELCCDKVNGCYIRNNGDSRSFWLRKLLFISRNLHVFQQNHWHVLLQ